MANRPNPMLAKALVAAVALVLYLAALGVGALFGFDDDPDYARNAGGALAVALIAGGLGTVVVFGVRDYRRYRRRKKDAPRST